MKTAQFLIAGALLVSLAAAQYSTLNHGNCSEAQIGAIAKACQKTHLADMPEIVEFLPTLASAEDPDKVMSGKACSEPEKTSAYVECMYEEYENCHYNMSSADDLPNPSSVKKAVLYLCEQKDLLLETMNETDVGECVKGKEQDIQNCVMKMVKDNTVMASMDRCDQSSMMAECLKLMNECTGGEPVLATYVGYFQPERCAACTVSMTLTLLLAALTAAVFN